jgi:hypothetical protein
VGDGGWDVDDADADDAASPRSVGLGLFVRKSAGGAAAGRRAGAGASARSSTASMETDVPFEGYPIDMRMLDSILEEAGPAAADRDKAKGRAGGGARLYSVSAPTRAPIHDAAPATRADAPKRASGQPGTERELSDSFGVLALSDDAGEAADGYVVVPRHAPTVTWLPSPPRTASAGDLTATLREKEAAARAVRDFVEILDAHAPATARGLVLELCLKALALFGEGLELAKRAHALLQMERRPLDALTTTVMGLQSGFNACLSYAEHLRTVPADPVDASDVPLLVYDASLAVLQTMARGEMAGTVTAHEAQRVYSVVSAMLSMHLDQTGPMDRGSYQKLLAKLQDLMRHHV